MPKRTRAEQRAATVALTPDEVTLATPAGPLVVSPMVHLHSSAQWSELGRGELDYGGIEHVFELVVKYWQLERRPTESDSSLSAHFPPLSSMSLVGACSGAQTAGAGLASLHTGETTEFGFDCFPLLIGRGFPLGEELDAPRVDALHKCSRLVEPISVLRLEIGKLRVRSIELLACSLDLV